MRNSSLLIYQIKIKGLAIEIMLLHVSHKLQSFIQSRGDFTTTLGVHMKLGSELELGAADGATGYPRHITGVGRGQGQVGKPILINFNTEVARTKFLYGLRKSLAELVHNYHRTVEGIQNSLPYVLIAERTESSPELNKEAYGIRGGS